ncbi:2-isopropylmalate synthase [Labeo rohita]|uniref:2-isopropylmalate synthase n=1 Tax=Labeo rohita TaxID=84645 RepID=A0ABQ8L1Y6_LABRO|nr:2-isopropylmalate synthase [Labeo rohita]
MFFSCSDRVILMVVMRVEVGRSLTVKQFQQLLGLMAAASNVIHFGLLYMRPLQWWLKTKGFSLRGNLLCMIKGPVLGAPCLRVKLATDASLTGWGVVMNGHPTCGHHPAWHISCLEMLAMFQCPREISLPTLSVLQGAAVSSEPTPQSLPPRQRSGAGELATPAGVSRTVSSIIGSVEATAKCHCICMGPAHCRVRLSHSIRGAPPPPFNGVCPTVVSLEQGLVMEQEVDTLLRKEAIDVVPPHDRESGFYSRESGFYSRYFIFPKKDGGLRPFLDLRQLNRSDLWSLLTTGSPGSTADLRQLNCSAMWLKFRMLTVSQVLSQIRSEDWFVTIVLKGAYFHVSILPQHKKFLSTLPLHFHEVCSGSTAAPGHPHTRLHRRLVDSGSIGALRCSPRSDERVGVETERQEECAVSITENHLSRRGVGFDHDAGMFVTCSDRVDPHRSHESERRLVTHCKAVPTTAGSDGVQRDTFWPVVHETLTVVAQDQARKPWFLSEGPVLGAPCCRVTLATDESLTSWEVVMSGHPSRGLWNGCHLTWHINCLEMLAVFQGNTFSRA